MLTLRGYCNSESKCWIVGLSVCVAYSTVQFSLASVGMASSVLKIKKKKYSALLTSTLKTFSTYLNSSLCPLVCMCGELNAACVQHVKSVCECVCL